jgi:hypothetical protein
MSLISGVSSSNPNLASTDIQNQWEQRRQHWQKLEQSLRSGDMDSAQQAFSAIQKDMEKVKQASSSRFQKFEQDMETLQSAVNSGDLQASQQAFAALQKPSTHEARHPHPEPARTSTDGSPTPTNPTSNTPRKSLRVDLLV